MITPRETIYAALFAKFNGLVGTTLVTASRRWKPWSDVAAEMQPALYQMQVRETDIVQGRGIPTKYKLDVDVFIYVKQQDDTAPYSTTLNPILDALDAKLVPDDVVNNECTLGGLVQRCRITGAVEIFEGVSDGRQIVAVLPIEILAL